MNEPQPPEGADGNYSKLGSIPGPTNPIAQAQTKLDAAVQEGRRVDAEDARQPLGTVTAETAVIDPPGDSRTHAREVTQRLQRDGRWGEAQLIRNRMIKEARAAGMTRDDAQGWAYSELDRLYPPLLREPPDSFPNGKTTPSGDTGRVQGLTPPAAWGELPLNATLQAELSWVQSHRLDVVEDLPGGATIVHLDRAREPAPSMGALGWLETSIRSYAKYVDIVARSLTTAQDEREHQRRERMRIEDVEQLIAETWGQGE